MNENDFIKLKEFEDQEKPNRINEVAAEYNYESFLAEFINKMFPDWALEMMNEKNPFGSLEKAIEANDIKTLKDVEGWVNERISYLGEKRHGDEERIRYFMKLELLQKDLKNKLAGMQ